MSRTLVVTAFAALFAAASGPTLAQDAKKAEAKAKEAGCLTCHDVAKKKVGPALKDAGAKYKGAPDKLATALKGLKDHEGAVKKLSDDDLKLVSGWIASL